MRSGGPTSAPSPGSWRTQPAANAYDAWLAGVADEASDWSRITTTIEPDPATSEGYDQLYRSFRKLYPATKAVVRDLVARTRER